LYLLNVIILTVYIVFSIKQAVKVTNTNAKSYYLRMTGFLSVGTSGVADRSSPILK